MKTTKIRHVIVFTIALLTLAAHAQTLVPKWNNTSITLGSGNNGLGYSPLTGDVIASVCASGTAGNATIYRLKFSDGTSAGANLTVNSTITGGTYVIGGLTVGSDGVIYACNYGAAGATKIYSWANESATPAQLGPTFTVGAGSIGKNLTVYGTGNNAVFLVTGTTTNVLYVYYDTGTSTWKAKVLGVSSASCTTSLAFVSWSPTSCTFVSKNSSASGYQGVFNPSSASPIAVTQTAITGWASGSGTIQNVAYDPVTQLAGTFTRNVATPWTITVNTWETGIPAGTLTAPVAQTAQTANATATDGGAAGSCCWGSGAFLCMPAVAGFGVRAFDVTAFKVADITPAAQTNNVGQTATFSVVSGGSALTYVWQRNGSPIANGGDFANATTAVLTISPFAAADAGTYTCTVSGVSGSTWTSSSGLLAVNQPTATNSLTLTLGNNPSTYGDSLTFTATIAGGGATPTGSVMFEDSTTPIATNTLSGSGSAATATFTITNLAAGSHSIIAVYGGDSTYAGSTSSPLGQTVNRLAVILSGARLYDGSASTAFGVLSVANAIPGDAVNAASGNVNLSGAGVGLQSISDFTNLVLGGAAAGNYTLTGASGSVTISNAPLSITATAQTKTYGQTVVFGSGSPQFASSGLQNGETIGSVTLTCGGGDSNAPVSASPYTITPSAAAGGTFNAADYTITYNINTLTVNPLAVVLTGTQTYNGTTNVTNPTLSVANAVGGDDVNAASGSADMANAAIGTNSLILPGTLVLGGTAAGNYTMTGASGAVVVTPLVITLTGTRPYDGTNDADASILTIATNYDGANLTLSGSATLASAAAGEQSISDHADLVLSGTAATNYTLAGASGSVTITTVPLIIAANPVSKTYGTAITLNPTAFTVSSGPLVGSELVTAVTMTASGGTAATDLVSGSPYTITPTAATGTGGFLASNYNITYSTNTLTVNPLTVVLSGTRPYDGTATATAGVLAVANKAGSDDVSAASGSVVLASSWVGMQGITDASGLALGGLAAPNYALTGASGSVAITDPGLPFSITSVYVDNTGTNVVTVFESIPGNIYQMLSSEDLTTWTNEGSPITATGTLTTNIAPEGVTKAYIYKNSK